MAAAAQARSLKDQRRLPELILERSPAAHIALSADGTVIYWSRGAERLSGYSSREAVGRSVFELMVPEAKWNAAGQMFREAVERGSAIGLTNMTRKDGSLVRVAGMMDVVRDRSGVIDMVILTKRDAAGLKNVRLVRDPDGPDPLTARQREVLELIAEGLSTAEVAKRLRLSVKTVETHRVNLMNRLGIRTVAGLVRYAVASGIVSLGWAGMAAQAGG